MLDRMVPAIVNVTRALSKAAGPLDRGWVRRSWVGAMITTGCSNLVRGVAECTRALTAFRVRGKEEGPKCSISEPGHASA